MAGHSAGDRVDGELDFDALGFEQVGHLLDGVLGLRHGQAVARHHDHLVGVRHLDGGVGGRGGLDRTLVPAGRTAHGVGAAEGTKHNRRNGPVHRNGHQIGQNRT